MPCCQILKPTDKFLRLFSIKRIETVLLACHLYLSCNDIKTFFFLLNILWILWKKKGPEVTKRKTPGNHKWKMEKKKCFFFFLFLFFLFDRLFTDFIWWNISTFMWCSTGEEQLRMLSNQEVEHVDYWLRCLDQVIVLLLSYLNWFALFPQFP